MSVVFVETAPFFGTETSPVSTPVCSLSDRIKVEVVEADRIPAPG